MSLMYMLQIFWDLEQWTLILDLPVIIDGLLSFFGGTWCLKQTCESVSPDFLSFNAGLCFLDMQSRCIEILHRQFLFF